MLPSSTVVVNAPIEQVGSGAGSEMKLDEIWKTALERYSAENGISEEELSKAGDFDNVSTGAQKTELMFDTARHPENRNDKAMTAIEGCLDWVDTAANFLTDNLDGTYATPVKVICGAINIMVRAANDLKSDFDMISDTFGMINNALSDVSLLGKHPLSQDHFASRLTAVFLSLFDFCSFSTKIFSTSRKRWYIRALIKGRNEKILAKCATVTSTIQEFRDTVPLKNLEVAEDTLEVATNTLQVSQDTYKVTGNTLAEVQDLQKGFQNFPELIEQRLLNINVRAAILERLNPDVETLQRVKKYFGVKLIDAGQNDAQLNVIKSQFVDGTFEWLKDNRDFQSWYQAQDTPFLRVTGAKGSGKTYFTYHCFRTMQEMAKDQKIAKNTSQSRQTVSVAYVYFDPARPETHSLKRAFASIICQIAKQDARFCKTIDDEIKGLEDRKQANTDTRTGREPADRDKAVIAQENAMDNEENDLWETFILPKFSKTAEVFRSVYILIDGVDQPKAFHGVQELSEKFQHLNCDKFAIQVMMTGDKTLLKNMKLRCREIDLPARSSEFKDLEKIVMQRISASEHLSKFGANAQTEMMIYFLSEREDVDVDISWILLTLSVMEQIGDEESALKKMRESHIMTKLYDSMIQTVMRKGRSSAEQKSLQTLYSWCTFAANRLSVHELQQLWNLDPSLGAFDVNSETQNKSKDILCIVRHVPTQNEYDEELLESRDDESVSMVVPRIVSSVASDKPYNYIDFRQPSFREYLEETSNESVMEIIGDPLGAKIDIFSNLCNVLTDNTPSLEESRKVLHAYAAQNFLFHLLRIDVSKASSEDGKIIVESMLKVLENQNNASAIFEASARETGFGQTSLPLYDSDDGWKRILSWAKKMAFYENEDLTDSARTWVSRSVRKPKTIFESLIRGHIINLSEKRCAIEAEIPFRFAFQALKVSSNRQFYTNRISWSSAKLILRFSDKWLDDDPVVLARIRNAIALLLNASASRDDQEKAAQLFRENLRPRSGATGPERFYAHLGMAEYYAHPTGKGFFDDLLTKIARDKICINTTSRCTGPSESNWEKALTEAELALQERIPERGALGSELDNQRCTTAFWLKASSLQKLGRYDEALETCRQALAPGELIYSEKLLSFLTLTVDILSAINKPSQLIAKVMSHSNDFKSEWLWASSRSSSDRLFKHDVLRKAAVDIRRVDFVIQLYDVATAYWRSRDWCIAQTLLINLAVIYRRDARATNMAEIVLNNIWKDCEKNRAKKHSRVILDKVFAEMVDVLFERYTVAGDELSKLVEVGKLEEIVDYFHKSGLLEPMRLAAARLTLAKTLNRVGRLRDAKVQANDAFTICMEDLQDSRVDNDRGAFGVLGRVLHFVGMNIDSGIALSLLFSDVLNVRQKRSRYRNRSASSDSSDGLRSGSSSRTRSLSRGRPSLLLYGSGQNSTRSFSRLSKSSFDSVIDTTRDKSQDKLMSNGVTAALRADIDIQASFNGVNEAESEARKISSVETTGPEVPTIAVFELDRPAGNDIQFKSSFFGDSTAAPPVPDGQKHSFSVGTSDEHHDLEVNGSSRVSDGNHNHLTSEFNHEEKVGCERGRPTKSVGERSVYGSRTDDRSTHIDEDLTMEGGRAECSGPCETPGIYFWPESESFFVCLDCWDTILCESCHKQQTEYWTDMGEGFWTKVCWAEHEFVKLPIADWEGVKFGYITIGNRKKLFKLWLEDVKMKWKRELEAMTDETRQRSTTFSSSNGGALKDVVRIRTASTPAVTVIAI